jgi:hypothetical protein
MHVGTNYFERWGLVSISLFFFVQAIFFQIVKLKFQNSKITLFIYLFIYFSFLVF